MIEEFVMSDLSRELETIDIVDNVNDIVNNDDVMMMMMTMDFVSFGSQAFDSM